MSECQHPAVEMDREFGGTICSDCGWSLTAQNADLIWVTKKPFDRPTRREAVSDDNMEELRRHRIRQPGQVIDPCSEGEWVRFSDVQEREARLKARIEELPRVSLELKETRAELDALKARIKREAKLLAQFADSYANPEGDWEAGKRSGLENGASRMFRLLSCPACGLSDPSQHADECPVSVHAPFLAPADDEVTARLEELIAEWERWAANAPDEGGHAEDEFRRGSGLAYGDAAQALRAALDERKEA